MGLLDILNQILGGAPNAINKTNRDVERYYSQMKNGNYSNDEIVEEFRIAKENFNTAKQMACAKIAKERGMSSLN